MPAPTDVITAGQDGLAAAIRAAASRPNPEVTTLVADLAHVVEELTRVLEEETAALSVKDMDRMRALQADKQRLGRGYEQLYALLGRQDQAAVRAAPDFGAPGRGRPALRRSGEGKPPPHRRCPVAQRTDSGRGAQRHRPGAGPRHRLRRQRPRLHRRPRRHHPGGCDQREHQHLIKPPNRRSPSPCRSSSTPPSATRPPA